MPIIWAYNIIIVAGIITLGVGCRQISSIAIDPLATSPSLE